jgi:hypothetical protein
LDFSFVYDGKAYKVYAKEGQYHKLGDYYKFIAYIAPKRNLHPANYSHVGEYFDIIPPLPPPPNTNTKLNEPEQLSFKFAKNVVLRFLKQAGNLLIDDQWDPSKLPGVTDSAKTYEDGLRLLKQGGWDTVYLDNDLGPGKEGWELLSLMMREASQDPSLMDLWPNKFVVFSSNLDARKTMYSKLQAMGYVMHDTKPYPTWERSTGKTATMWEDNRATIFFDEIQNKGIDPEKAIKVINMFKSLAENKS